MTKPARPEGPYPLGGFGMLAGLLAAWAFFVLVRHVKLLNLDVVIGQLGTLYDPGRYPGLESAGRTFMVYAGHAWHLGAALAAAVAAIGLGLEALKPLRLKCPGRGLMEILAFAAGFALLGLAQLGGGLLGLMYAGWPLGWIGAGLWLFWPQRRRMRALVPDGGDSWAIMPFKVAALGAGLFIAAVALAPEVFYDSLVYHVADPFNWAKVHKIAFLPYNFFSNFPFTFEMLFGIGTLLGHDSIGRLLHAAISFGAAGLLGWAAWWLAARSGAAPYSCRAAGWIAAAIYLTTPLIATSAWMTGIDAGLVLYEGAMVLGVMLWWSGRRERNWLLAAAVLGGMGMGAKYTLGLTIGLLGIGVAARAAAPDERQALRVWLAAILLGLAPVTAANLEEFRNIPGGVRTLWILAVVYAAGAFAFLVWLVRGWGGKNLLAGAKRAFLFGFAAWLFVSPWNLKSWLFTRNPVYPFAYEAFDSFHVSPPRMDYQMGEFREFSRRTIKEFALLPWGLTDKSGYSNNSSCGALFLGLLPLLLVFRRVGNGIKLLGLIVFGKYLLWANLSNIVRYFAPGLGLLAVLIGVFVEHAAAGRRLVRFIGRACVLVFSLANIFNILLVAQGSVNFLGVVLGVERERSFFLRERSSYPCPPYLACEKMNASLPADAGVLFLGEARGAFCRRRLLAPTVFDFPPLTELCRDSFDAAEVNKRLRQFGLTHVFFNGAEARRTGGYGIFDWPTPHSRELFERWWAEHLELEWRAGELEIYSINEKPLPERTAALKLVQVHYQEYRGLENTQRAAVASIQAGDYGRAEILARELVGAAPGVAANREILAHALAMRGKYGEALAAYRSAAGLGLHTSQLYYNIAAVCGRMGRRRDAVEAYQRASEVEVRWPEPK